MNAPPVFIAAAQDYATRLLEAIECPPGHPEDLLPRPPRTASPAAGFSTYRTLFPELGFAAASAERCRSAGRSSALSGVLGISFFSIRARVSILAQLELVNPLSSA